MNNFMISQSKIWDSILPRISLIDSDPEKEISNFLLDKLKNKKIDGLDIGCGFGRHTLLALKMGLNMTSVDFSSEAINTLSSFFEKKRLFAKLYRASMDNLPFEDSTFDFSISWCVLNHGTQAIFNKGLVESIRVLRKNGNAIGLIMNKQDSRFGKGDIFDHDCYIFEKGLEKGICHYFPSTEEIKDSLQKISNIQLIKHVSYSDKDTELFYPELKYTSHILYIVSK